MSPRGGRAFGFHVEYHDADLRAGIARPEEVLAAWPPAALLDWEALTRGPGCSR